MITLVRIGVLFLVFMLTCYVVKHDVGAEWIICFGGHCDEVGAWNRNFFSKWSAANDTNKERLSRIKEICGVITANETQINRIIISKPLTLIYCPVDDDLFTFNTDIHQAAFSRVKQSKKLKIKDSRNSRLLYSSLAAQKKLLPLDKYFKFTFVRHPFARLLTAYKKTMTSNASHYYKQLQNAVIETFRRKAGQISAVEDVRDPTPTLLEFFLYLTSDVQNSWPEILLRERNNALWRLQIDIIDPCAMTYDFIGKLETQGRDYDDLRSFVRSRAQPEGGREVLLLNDYFKSRRGLNSDSMKQALLKVPNSVFLALYKKYQRDFIMFNY